MRHDASHPDDPFGGCGPQPVRCRWLSPEDEARADSARIIRLIVDSSRWGTHFSNAVYQRNVIRDVAAFIGPTQALLVTPAGMVTTIAPYLNGSLASIMVGLRAADEALSGLDLGLSPEILLGLDCCVPGEATPLQSVVYLAREPRMATTVNTTIKLYPNNGESATLAGWLLTEAIGEVPVELTQARRIRTTAGMVLTLVCHDACLFSSRSRANLRDQTGLRIRAHFEEAAVAEPIPKFALLATHIQESTRSGGIFKNAAAALVENAGLTAVTTMFTPKDMLEEMARSFPPLGDRADKVVTVLVEDTWEGG